MSRAALKEAAVDFHTRAGTLTKNIRLAIERLEESAPIIRVAHQPILLPYLSLMAQFILLSELARELRSTHRIIAVQVYEVVDYDAITEKRLRVSHYPHIGSRNGLLHLSTPPPARHSLETLQHAGPKPPEVCVKNWFLRLPNC